MAEGTVKWFDGNSGVLADALIPTRLWGRA